MEQSILKSTKQMLDIGPDDASFDFNIITYINSAFSTLNDLGVGPANGFSIEDETAQWTAYISDDLVELNKVKTCVWLEVKLLFDPPALSFLLEATQKQLLEAQWRLNVNREAADWVEPDPVVVVPDDSDGFGTGGFGL